MTDLALSSYDFELPPDAIAQHPTGERDASRLLVLDRTRETWSAGTFNELPDLLHPGDLLVLNDARVAPARLIGRRPTGGKVEVLLVSPLGAGRWRAMARARRKLPPGEVLTMEGGGLTLTVVGFEDGLYTLEGPQSWEALEGIGRAPLPPYIRRPPDDPQRDEDLARYQTVYASASASGAVAAPTAGLHFTPALLARLEAGGVELARVSLLVGLGTFLPIKAPTISAHAMHEEAYRLETPAAAAIERARAAGRRIVAVGTTSCRVLETLAREQQPPLQATEGTTRLFLHPPQKMQLTGALLTNFHLPRSSLLMLVSAMAGRELVLRAYTWARDAGFRFYSYGDAMLIV